MGSDEFAGFVDKIARRYEARVSVYHEYISSGLPEDMIRDMKG